MRLLHNATPGTHSINTKASAKAPLAAPLLITAQDPKMTVQVSGALGTGGKIQLYFSLLKDGPYVALGSEISALGITLIDSTEGYFAAAVTGGDGGTSLSVDIGHI